MKKVININFQGRVVPIEETAYDLLKNYTESLRNYFANEEGRDEIINDIESRIGELFQDRIKNGAICITDDDVNVIINNMGRPQDFAAADSDDSGSSSANKNSGADYQYTSYSTTRKRLYRDVNNKVIGGVCSGIAAYFGIEPIIIRLVFIFSGIGFLAYILMWAFVPPSDNIHNGVRKRLYRNPDEKFIAGVCSGIASYFNINVWIPRLVFLIPFISFFFRWGHFGPLTFPNFVGFSFSPGTLLIYIILWIVIPEANSTSEKLEMKGEKVDLNSIKNSVVEEMKDVKDRMSKFGKEAKDFAKQSSSAVAADMGHAARRSRRGIGDFIIIILKIFLFFMLGVFALSMFGVAIAATSIFPIKNFLLRDGWQNVFAWGTLIFFIYVPVVAVITWIIRRLAKIRSNSRMMRFSFFILWLVGLFCFISLIVSLGQDFKSNNTVADEKITLVNPSVEKLEVTSNGNTRYNMFRMEPFANFDDDTAYVRNVSLKLVKSKTDSFQVTITKYCRGRNRHYADTLAATMSYNIQQLDSLLILDKGIAITENDKFRNQHVIVTIAVPVGKRILVNNKVGWGNWAHFDGPWNDGNWDNEDDWDNQEHGWRTGVEYIMKPEGLYTLKGIAADRNKRNTRSDYDQANDEDNDVNNSKPAVPGNGGTYRYDQTVKAIDSLKIVKEKEMQNIKDSLQKAKEQLEQKIQKLNDSTRPKTEAFYRPGDQRYDFILNI